MDIKTVRSKIADIKAQIAAIQDLPWSEAEMAAVLDEQLNLLEVDYTEKLRFIGTRLALGQHWQDFRLSELMGESAGTQLFFRSLLARFLRDELREDLLAVAKAVPIPRRMPATERLDTLARLRHELYELELADEAAVEAGRAPRRDDADPRAVLGLPMEIAFTPEMARIVGS